MIQDIVTLIAVALAIVYIAVKLYKFITAKGSACGSCCKNCSSKE